MSTIHRYNIFRQTVHNTRTCSDRFVEEEEEEEEEDLPPLVVVSDSEEKEEFSTSAAVTPSNNPLNVPVSPSRLSPEVVDLSNSFDVVNLVNDVENPTSTTTDIIDLSESPIPTSNVTCVSSASLFTLPTPEVVPPCLLRGL